MEYKVHIRYSFNKKLDDGRFAYRYADQMVKLTYNDEQSCKTVTNDSIKELKKILKDVYKREPLDITILDIKSK